MRIVIDGRMLSWTGIGRYSRHLLDELARLDGRNEFVVLVAGDHAADWRPPGPNFRSCVADFKPYSLEEQRGLGPAIDRLSPDLVHFTHFNVPVRYRGPYLVTIHDLTMTQYRNSCGGPLTRLRSEGKFHLGRRVLRQGVQRAQRVITTSQYTAQRLADSYGVGRDRVVVTNAAATPLECQPLPLAPLDDGRPYLLYVGNFYPHKNVDALVDAFAQLVPTRPDLRLAIVGGEDCFQARLRKRVASGGVAQNVVFTGYVEDAQLLWLYQHARALAFPSLSEGFGLPGLEAMAHGVPVVSSDGSSLPEVYGDAAAYFDPRRPDDMARSISSVLDDEARRAELITAGAHRVGEYSWRRMAELTLGCYESVGRSVMSVG